MRFIVERKIFDEFPKVIIAVVVGKDVKNSETCDELSSLLQEQEEKTHEVFKLNELKRHVLIANWVEIYKKFGEKEKIASHHALIKRILKGKGLPRISALVDCFNYVSLKYVTPIGGEDLDRVKGDIKLCFARGNERFIPLGSSELRHPKKGEVVYKDEEKVLCRCWNWRESEEAKITLDTKNVIYFIDVAPPLDERVARAASEELKGLLFRFCCAKSVETFIVKLQNPEIMVR